MKKLIIWISLWMVAVTVASHAQHIRITRATGDKISIDLSGMTIGGDEASRLFLQTLQGNLSRSGWFMLGRAGHSEVRATGRVTLQGDQLVVECTVLDVAKQRQHMSRSYRLDARNARRLAHRVADDVVQAVTGYKGIASTKIVFVGVQDEGKELFICDADGGDMIQLTADRSIAVRPRWSPKADAIVYTSYLKRYPDIYHIELASGKRTIVSNQSGLNAGGVISPDGRDMALILSRDGNPELYIRNMATGRLTRLTQTSAAAEASPSWSPDGRRIVYVSDSTGRPHLYIIARDGGSPRRVTSRGSENVAPDWGPNNRIAFASRVGGRYQIGMLDPDSQDIAYLEHPDFADYEDPSWAPNGRHLVVSRKENYRSTLYIVDTMGDPQVRLHDHRGDWYSPAWSPE
jgi:TolB protein